MQTLLVDETLPKKNRNKINNEKGALAKLFSLKTVFQFTVTLSGSILSLGKVCFEPA
jgi:hypothetical protein